MGDFHDRKRAVAAVRRACAAGALPFALGLLVLVLAGTALGADLLTAEERAWLRAHDRRIRFAPSPTYAPVCSRTPGGDYQGITMDVVRLMEQRLGVRFQIVSCATWDEILEKARAGEVDLVGNIQQTAEREAFLRFTKPYVTIANAIIVRRGVSRSLTLAGMEGMRVAVVRGYATEAHIAAHYPGLELLPVRDNAAGLQAVSMGNAHATVTDLAVASHTIERLGIGNLQVAGEVPELAWELRFGCRRDWPVLQGILEKGLASIGAEETRAIRQRWISLGRITPVWRDWRLYAAAVAVLLGCLMVAYLWNRSLARVVRARTGELAASRDDLRITLDSIGDGVIATDGAGLVVRMNPAAEQLTGWRLPEAAGRPLPDVLRVVDADTREPVNNPAEQVVGGEPLEASGNPVLVAKDGEEFRIELSAAPMRDDAGRVRGAVVVCSDVSEQFRMQEALRESEEQKRNILDYTSALVYIKDPDGRYLFVNRRYREVCGVADAEVKGRTDRDVFPEDIAAAFQANDRKVLDGGQPKEFEEVLGHGDARRLFFSIKFPLKDVHGKVYAVCGMSTDITARRRLEQELRQSRKLDSIGQLAGGVAHDFNNQLSAVLGYAELLLEHLKDTELRKFAAQIRAAALRSSDLTGKLLAFSRKGQHKRVPVDVHRIIDETVEMLRHSIDKRIVIERDLKAGRCRVSGDPTQLQNAILNIALNARDAMPDGGTLTFGTEVSAPRGAPSGGCADEMGGDPCLVLTVADTGCGMSPEVQARIFEPFFTTKEQGKGTGMGLAAVYGTVRQHGGAIRVESAVGKGAVFQVCLPLSEDASAEPGENGGGKAEELGGLRVLLVDDECMVRDVAEVILRRAGCAVLSAADGEEAVALYRERRREIDLVILDLVMPRMSGGDALQAMKALNPAVRVLLVSGYSLNEEVQKMLDTGAAGFVRKPFRQVALLRAVSDAVAGGRGKR